jgi:acyl carrier protein
MPPAAFTQRPLRWLKAVSDYRATHTGGPNFAYDLCVRRISEAEREELDLRSWHLAYNGAEPVRRASLEQFADTFGPCGFHRKVLSPGYGLAEFTLFVSGSSPHERATYLDVQPGALERNEVVAAAPNQDAQCLVGCGRPGADVQVEIVHPKTCEPVAPGHVGEIWLSSRSVAKGYWNKPEETEYTFEARLAGTTGPRYLRTGDLGFLKDGELFITGRLKDLIIIRGRNLYPQDIEFTAERSSPALRSGFGAAFSVTVEDEERLVITYEVERSVLRGIDADQVAYAVENAILEEHEVKAHEVLLLKTGAIPKTSSGKIQRRACRAAYLSGSLDAIGQRRVSTESTVVKPIARKDEELALRIFPIVSEFVWQTRGRHALVKRESRIRADLGLDSLDVTVLTARLEEAIGVTIDLAKVDHLDTVDDLVQIIGTVMAELEKTVDSFELTLERSRNEIPRLRANGLDSTAAR